MIECVLWGGYAGGNVGDELTLAVGLQDMKLKYSQDRLAILSSNPTYTAWQFPDIRVIEYERIPSNHALTGLIKRVKRNRILSGLLLETLLGQKERYYIRKNLEWVRTLREASELYLVGGGYLTDLFHLDEVLVPVLIAQHYGKVVNTAPVGAGPFKDTALQRIFVKTFQGIKLTVRDSDSQLQCVQLGLEVKLSCDDGFRLMELPVFSSKANEPRKSEKIGVCIYQQHGAKANARDYFSWWKDFLTELISLGFKDQIEGFCFHNSIGLDFRYMVKLFAEVGIPIKQVTEPILDFSHATLNLQKYPLVITTRFHAAVAASVLKVPFFAISSGPYYRKKMNSVIECSGKGMSIDLEQADAKLVAQDAVNQYLDQVKRLGMK